MGDVRRRISRSNFKIYQSDLKMGLAECLVLGLRQEKAKTVFNGCGSGLLSRIVGLLNMRSH
jgi:hypothetical protein